MSNRKSTLSCHSSKSRGLSPMSSRDGCASATCNKPCAILGKQFSLALPKDVEGSIEYRGHVQNVGWDAWVADGAPCGTTSRSLRLEAVQARLAGKLADTHSVWYRVHTQNVGTMGWARDGQAAGTAGQSLRLESVEVQVLPKGEVPADYAEGQASYVGAVSANVHVQNRGWMPAAADGALAGTTG